MIGADNLECLLGQTKCTNVAVIPNRDHPGTAGQQEERIGFSHADGAVTFSTNLWVPGRPPARVPDAVSSLSATLSN